MMLDLVTMLPVPPSPPLRFAFGTLAFTSVVSESRDFRPAPVCPCSPCMNSLMNTVAVFDLSASQPSEPLT